MDTSFGLYFAAGILIFSVISSKVMYEIGKKMYPKEYADFLKKEEEKKRKKKE